MKNIYIGTLIFVVFMVLGYMVQQNIFSIVTIDRSVATFFGEIRSSNGLEVMRSVTTFGETSILTPIIILSMLFFLFKKHWEFGVVFALGIWIAGYLMGETKDFFEIARPRPFYGNAGGYSYPSGHVSNAAIVFFILSLYFAEIKNKYVKLSGITLCVLATVSVGISRMYLNVHWLTDVIGGILLAVSVGLILYGIVQVLEKKKA